MKSYHVLNWRQPSVNLDVLKWHFFCIFFYPLHVGLILKMIVFHFLGMEVHTVVMFITNWSQWFQVLRVRKTQPKSYLCFWFLLNIRKHCPLQSGLFHEKRGGKGWETFEILMCSRSIPQEFPHKFAWVSSHAAWYLAAMFCY